MAFFSYNHTNISVYIISIMYYSLFLASQGYCSELESEECWADPPGFVHPVWNSWTQLPPCTSHTLHSNVWSHVPQLQGAKKSQRPHLIWQRLPRGNLGLEDVPESLLSVNPPLAFNVTLQKTGRHFRSSLLLFQGKMSVPSLTSTGQHLDEEDHVCFSGNQK